MHPKMKMEKKYNIDALFFSLLLPNSLFLFGGHQIRAWDKSAIKNAFFRLWLGKLDGEENGGKKMGP